ncbi:hypothetical protein HELRODRAFT_163386 [Helobdella robusta]|uniref:Uncharacterized protein n=1 Tax=Helobdella robusta TaxID=6412 RepID=T1ETZ6_HELRO|nr:hypothetical protein HELRODRAFT_163386 [Helobdella robusta]ESN96333.1 hypothetical protein HELRODRAFT_163386 [Helobdella robusta]
MTFTSINTLVPFAVKVVVYFIVYKTQQLDENTSKTEEFYLAKEHVFIGKESDSEYTRFNHLTNKTDEYKLQGGVNGWTIKGIQTKNSVKAVCANVNHTNWTALNWFIESYNGVKTNLGGLIANFTCNDVLKEATNSTAIAIAVSICLVVIIIALAVGLVLVRKRIGLKHSFKRRTPKKLPVVDEYFAPVETSSKFNDDAHQYANSNYIKEHNANSKKKWTLNSSFKHSKANNAHKNSKKKSTEVGNELTKHQILSKDNLNESKCSNENDQGSAGSCNESTNDYIPMDRKRKKP